MRRKEEKLKIKTRSIRLLFLSTLLIAVIAVAQDVRSNLGSILNKIQGPPSALKVAQGKRVQVRAERKNTQKRRVYIARRDSDRSTKRGRFQTVSAGYSQSDAQRQEKQRQIRIASEQAARKKEQSRRAARDAKVAADRARVAAQQAKKQAERLAKQREAARLAAVARQREEQARRDEQALEARRREEQELREAQEKAAARQNITLAFVNPQRQPVEGVRLVARVQTPQEEEPGSVELVTDEKGHIRLSELALPAAIEFDMPEQAEWEFSQGESSTLLVEELFGTSRLAVVPSPRPARLASTRLVQLNLPEAPAAGSVRRRIYEGMPSAPIVVERNVVDVEVSAPAGSRITSTALAGKTVTVPEEGNVLVRLPHAALAEGPIPLRVSHTLPGGEREAVITDYETDPYQVNRTAQPDTELVRLTSIDLGGSWLGSSGKLVKSLGDLKGKANAKQRLGSVLALPGGNEWWFYSQQGYAFLLLPAANPKDKKAERIIERVRLLNAQSGSWQGVRVGDPVADLRKHLGDFLREEEASTPADKFIATSHVASWRNGQFRFGHDGAKILWIEATDAGDLKVGDAVAFVRSPKVTLPGVMATRADIVAAVGDPKNKKLNAKVEPAPDVQSAGAKSKDKAGPESQWWHYPHQGISYKLRLAPGANAGKKDALMWIERVRLTGRQSGQLGGVQVGDSVETLYRHLGSPDRERPYRRVSDRLNPGERVEAWLEGGVRVCHKDSKILWIETTRSNQLLLDGTTAFVHRPKARLYVEDFEGHYKTNLVDLEDLRRYLRQLHSVEFVNSREDADLVLTAQVKEFYEDYDKVTSLLPYRYDCRTTLEYSLYDTVAERYVYRNQRAVGEAKVDYVKEAIAIGAIGGILAKKGGDWGKILGGLLVGGTLLELNKSMQKAANRCPAISSRQAFNAMVRDIDEASDFALRVVDIDYARGTVTLNGGSDHGIQVSRPGAPVEFEINVAGGWLPFSESPQSARYYTARVVSVTRDTSVCKLFLVNRSVKKFKENFKEEEALDMVRRFPSASTGLIEARAWAQFPDVTVISDAQVQQASGEESSQGNPSHRVFN